MKTLREVESLAEQAVSGTRGSSCEACCAAVEQHLHEQPYSEQVGGHDSVLYGKAGRGHDYLPAGLTASRCKIHMP